MPVKTLRIAALLGTSMFLMSVFPSLAPAVTKEEAIRQVNDLAGKVEGFRARLQITEKAGGIDCLSSSSLEVSKAYGFKTEIFRDGVQCQIISDFSTAYQYFPEGKQAMKMTVTRSEVRDLFRQPATHMNPLQLLDPKSLNFKGEETLAGEPVFRFEGTTTTQFLPQGEPVTSSMEAWISTRDGMPRKTIEKVAGNMVTTVYSDVEINPPFKAADFHFVPAPDVRVIDADQQLRTAPRPQSPVSPGTAPPKAKP